MTDSRGAVGSYDDLPESEVATVLEVPLVWPDAGAHDADPATAPLALPPTPAPTVLPSPQGGRHSEKGVTRGGVGRHSAPISVRTKSSPGPLVHTARIGLISAALVLSATAGVLLVVAWWLP